MTKLAPERSGAAASPSRRRIYLAALAVCAGVVIVAGAFELISRYLPPARVESALLGPAGIPLAFFVGMVSFFSPCILPLLPGYLSFVSGLGGEEMTVPRARRRVLAGTALFVLGFATMFTALGAVASYVGDALNTNQRTVNLFAGVIVIVMGAAFAIPGLVPALERERRPFLSRARPGLAGAYPLGLAFAAGWIPCVGIGLGVMLTLGYTERSVGRGAILLFFFSLGFGFWFIVAALGLQRAITASVWLKRRARALQAVGGAFLVAIGVLLVTDQWNAVITPLRRLINQFAPPV